MPAANKSFISRCSPWGQHSAVLGGGMTWREITQINKVLSMGTAFYQHPLTSTKQKRKGRGSQVMLWSLERRRVMERESWKSLPTISLVWWRSSQKRSYFLRSHLWRIVSRLASQTGNTLTKQDLKTSKKSHWTITAWALWIYQVWFPANCQHSHSTRLKLKYSNFREFSTSPGCRFSYNN